MKRLLVATRNPGKMHELAEALAPSGIEIVGLAELGDVTPVEETGTTFEENARLKAEAYSRMTDLPVLADDSGIEVDALGGAPGVESARFGGAGLDDEARNRLLLSRMAGRPDRTARFRCVLALAVGGRTVATFHGIIEGELADAPRGHNGFGYDPLFFHPPSGRTTAELSTAEKRLVSHRGKAIAALLAALDTGDPRLPN